MKKAFLFSGLIIFLAACGGGSQPETSTTESTESSESTEVVDDAPETVEEDGGMVEIQLTTVGETMADMEFSPKQVRVGAGSIVRVVLDNVAEAAAMVHNFVLVERGSAEEIYPLAIEAGPDNNYVPEHDAIIAFTPMANPGETVEVEFEAPAAGIYQFICTYPGHASMKGIFVVE
ncbi:MAG: hypothetical protein LAT54_09750 [Cryomorphaceae bacterium]|nr:hypothetical protein [Cryomorphaceae bacterium]